MLVQTKISLLLGNDFRLGRQQIQNLKEARDQDGVVLWASVPRKKQRVDTRTSCAEYIGVVPIPDVDHVSGRLSQCLEDVVKYLWPWLAVADSRRNRYSLKEAVYLQCLYELG